MMNLHFYKYQGTGNDFILFDNRNGNIHLNRTQIALLCDRRFGIGADGLMLLELADGYNFKMVYYNADGNESTMCGNGGRCIFAFAKQLGIINNTATFIAIDGAHHAEINSNGVINLKMQDVSNIVSDNYHTELNTGSPHYVTFVDDVHHTDVVHTGREIRNRNQYQPNGINVNFVQKTDDGIWGRTYERGVEDETLSCGTGVTAAAIAASGSNLGSFSTAIHTLGGNLQVHFVKDTVASAKEVVLSGPANFVFEGDINIV
jgi:diaminopimelate epimerase